MAEPRHIASGKVAPPQEGRWKRATGLCGAEMKKAMACAPCKALGELRVVALEQERSLGGQAQRLGLIVHGHEEGASNNQEGDGRFIAMGREPNLSGAEVRARTGTAIHRHETQLFPDAHISCRR